MVQKKDSMYYSSTNGCGTEVRKKLQATISEDRKGQVKLELTVGMGRQRGWQK